MNNFTVKFGEIPARMSLFTGVAEVSSFFKAKERGVSADVEYRPKFNPLRISEML